MQLAVSGALVLSGVERLVAIVWGVDLGGIGGDWALNWLSIGRKYAIGGASGSASGLCENTPVV